MSEDFIEQLRVHKKSSAEMITEANEAFNASLVSAQVGTTAIIKHWGKAIKNDPDQLKLAYEHDPDILEKYNELLAQGDMHRVCFRTFVVNAYIYAMIKASEADIDSVDELLNEINTTDLRDSE